MKKLLPLSTALFLFLIFSCNSSDPKNFVLGSWARDACNTDGSYEELKLVVESIGGELYKVSISIQTRSSGLIQKQVNGVFRNMQGRTAIELEDRDHQVIELFPEAKKIKYSGCWYTKQ